MRRLFLIALGLLILSPDAFAIVDTNDNGVSDFWEKQFNDGELFGETFDANADPDADGWTNAQEAAAGTDPFDPNPPDGLIRPEIEHIPAVVEVDEWGPYVVTPAAVTITWPTLTDKQYTLLFSADLTADSWIPVGDAFVGSGSVVTYGFEIDDDDKRFWRVAATDADTDGDGLTDFEERAIGSSIYLADTDGDGINDAEAYASGVDPSGDGSDADADGIPDNELYSVEIEVSEEGQVVSFDGAYKALTGTDDTYRYLVSTRTEEYSVSGSGRYGEVTDGKQSWTSSYLQGGALASSKPAEVEGGTSLDAWQQANAVTPGNGETFSKSATTTTVSAPTTTATETFTTTVNSTPWEITKRNSNGDKVIVSSGTEIITVVKRTKLTDPITYQTLWTEYTRKSSWEDLRSVPSVFGPLNWSSYNRYVSGDASAAEYVRDLFLNTDFEVGGTLSSPGSSYSDYGSDTRLKSLRWRWVRFNPLNPFELQSAAPPAGYRKALHLLLTQRNFLRENNGSSSAILLDETLTKGVVSIDCDASAGPGWHEVDAAKFAAFKLEEPTCHQDLDFSNYGHSQVYFENQPVRFTVFPPEPTQARIDAADGDDWEVETCQINADRPEFWIQTNVQAQGYDDDGWGVVPVEDGSVVTWDVLAEESDSGATLGEQTTATENGHTAVKLTVGTEPGSRYKVRGRLTTLKFKPRPDGEVVTLVNPEGFGTVKTQLFEVVPGSVSAIQLTTQATSLPADGKSITVLQANLTDKSGNPAARGTDVQWRLEGNGRIVNPQSVIEGENGVVTAALESGTLPASQQVVVEADGVTASLTLSNTSVQAASLTPATGSLDITTRQTTVCTLQTQGLADGAEVTWHTTKGTLTQTSGIIQNNTAQAILLADAGTTGTATVLATVGDKVLTCEVAFTSSAATSLSVSAPLVACDETSAGAEVLPLPGGETESTPWFGRTSVTIRSPGNPGAMASIAFAGNNHVLGVRFPFDSAVQNQSPSNIPNLSATLLGNAAVNTEPGHSRQGTGVLEFSDASDGAQIPHHQELSLNDGSVLHFSFLSDGSVGPIFNKNGEYSAEILATGILKFTLGAGSNATTLDIPQSAEAGKWHDVRISIEDGRMSLEMDGQLASAVLNSPPSATANALQIGGFRGRLDEWRISRIQPGFRGIAMVAQGLDSQSRIQLDASGEATFTFGAESTGAAYPEDNLGQTVDISAEVNGQTVTAKAAATVTTKGTAVLIRALAGKTAVIGTDTTNLNRDEMAESLLRRGVKEADRAGVLPKDLGSDATDRGQAGYLIAIWMEESVDEAGIIHPLMSVSAQNLPPEIATTLNMLLAEMMIQAGQRNSSEAFSDYILRNHKELLLALEALSQGDVDSYLRIARIADGNEAFADLSSTANQIGGGLVSRLASEAGDELANAYEIVRSAVNRRTTRLKLASLKEGKENVERQLRGPVLAAIQSGNDGIEAVLRDLSQGLHSAGVIDERAVAAIGAIYGFAHEGNDFAQDVAHPELFAKSVPILLDICLGAARGDAEAIEALKDVGAGVVMGPVNEIPQAADAWEAGEYFNAGRHQAAAAIAGVLVVKELKQSLQRGAYRAVGHGRKLKRLVGMRGEALAIARFRAKGYRDIVPIQNASGHGIDLIMRDRDGGIVVVEVKSHLLTDTPRVRSDMETFAKSRLENAESGNGHWKNVDAETRAHAVRFLNDIEKKNLKVRGIVVNVDYALTQFPRERYYEWAKGLGAEIFESDF